MSHAKRVSFHTLGCKLNYSETSTIARQFTEGGFVRSKPNEQADICVINTCSVTESADKKCRALIRKLVRQNPNAIIAVTGCYAQLKPNDIADLEGVDIVLGNNNKGELFSRVSALALSESKDINKRHNTLIQSCESHELTNFFAAFSSADRTRSFLKIQDGCSYKCSYCTIPYARGESRSASIESVVAEAMKIAAKGQKEIVITGINTGDFGRSTGENFGDLLRTLDRVEGIERYRISSIEPNLLTDEIIDIILKSRAFQPHFHIPLQSGSNTILGLMRRRYTTADFAARVDAVRRAMPNAFIGIDVIVGFPGETDEDFETTYRFLENLAPAYLHVFPYSERPGTPAIDFAGKVPHDVSSARVKRLMELCDRLHRDFTTQYIGQEALVLFENGSRQDKMTGFTQNYIKVHAPYDRARVNTICRVKLTAPVNGGDAKGICQ